LSVLVSDEDRDFPVSADDAESTLVCPNSVDTDAFPFDFSPDGDKGCIARTNWAIRRDSFLPLICRHPCRVTPPMPRQWNGWRTRQKYAIRGSAFSPSEKGSCRRCALLVIGVIHDCERSFRTEVDVDGKRKYDQELLDCAARRRTSWCKGVSQDLCRAYPRIRKRHRKQVSFAQCSPRRFGITDSG